MTGSRLNTTDRPARHIVIVGAGFGGLAAACALGKRGVPVTLIDRQNHHLFQPLLYQVATAALSPADIAAPIRAIVKRFPSVRVLMDEVTGVDHTSHIVRTANGADIPYDALIIATGAQHSYFGNDQWSAYAPGIKTIDDAIRVRRDILVAMERAETMRQEDPASRSKPIVFAVIGGGPTGVEMAGAIAELTRHAAAMDFKHISPTCVRVLLIEGSDRLLAAFSPESSAAALKSLGELGVEVMLSHRVTAIDANGVTANGELIPTAANIWAAGVQASPAAKWLGVTPDRSGRVPVDAQLRVVDRPDIFVLGDTAAQRDATGKAVPGIAPAAKQQGLHVASFIAAKIAGKREPRPFRYNDAGVLATIGRRRAVIDLPKMRLNGFVAWLLWSTVHLYFLVGFRNRFIVGLTWLWNYVTFERGVRLITAGAVSSPGDDPTRERAGNEVTSASLAPIPA